MLLQLLAPLITGELSLTTAPFTILSEGSPAGRGFGIVVAGVGDIDQDGAADIAVGDRDPGGMNPDPLWVYSGRDGRLLFHDPGVVWSVAAAGDVDADGIPDIAVGAPPGGRVLSGRDGRRLLELKHPDSKSRGFSVHGLGDIDCDGHSDVLIVGWHRFAVFSGRDGSVLHDVERAELYCIQVVGDVDGDGQTDLAYFARRPDRPHEFQITVLSSATFLPIRQILPQVQSLGGEDGFGSCIAPAGDVDCDGHADLLASREDAWVGLYSGRTGLLMRAFHTPTPGGYMEGFGRTIATLGDCDPNGWPEIAVGCEEDIDSGDGYYAAIFDGRSGSVIRTIVRPGFPGVYHRVTAVGDVDGDGASDLAVSTWEEGIVSVISGRTYSVLYELRRPLAR